MTNILLGSFLTYLHDPKSLAAAICRFLERQNQETSESRLIRAVPSLEGVRGTLRACQDQTSGFNWRNLLLAVGASLDISEWYAHFPDFISYHFINTSVSQVTCLLVKLSHFSLRIKENILHRLSL